MDGADLTTPAAPMELGSDGQTSSSRPSLGFPLGTALLLIVIFCLSGVFSCCYHWDKLRSLRGHPQDDVPEADRADVDHHLPPPHLVPSPLTLKLASKHLGYKQEKDQLSLPVIMPGDRIPKFIAWPCPCQVPPSSNLPHSAAPDHQKIALEEV